MAMAEVSGERMVSLAEVAARMKRSANSLSMTRRSLIRKGMIYSPSLGMVAYTVPMFDKYLLRMTGN